MKQRNNDQECLLKANIKLKSFNCGAFLQWAEGNVLRYDPTLNAYINSYLKKEINNERSRNSIPKKQK